jgi:hypothetical protein
MINEQLRAGAALLQHIKRHADVAQVVNIADVSPLPMPEGELLSHGEFKAHLEKRLHERLGMSLTL